MMDREMEDLDIDDHQDFGPIHGRNNSSKYIPPILQDRPYVFWILLVLIGVTLFATFIFLLAVISYLIKSKPTNPPPSPTPIEPKKPKNIIFMVADGFGPASQTFTRFASQQPILPLDRIFVGTSRTYSSSSDVTDSAAGATALACGKKSYNGAIAVDPSQKPCGTVMEAALTKNMKIGIVATTLLADATPASYSAHAISRAMLNEIAKQQIEDLKTRFAPSGKNHGLDVFFGGGRCNYAGKNSEFKSCRTDEWDGIKSAKQIGYTFASDRVGLSAISKMPAMGLFADDYMRFNIDRTTDDTEPTLLEMTKKAIDLLSADSANGFFLLVEGSRIDHAGHSNDIAAHYREILQYNEVVGYITEWAAKENNTLVVSTADHETGGLTLGRTIDGNTEYVYNTEIVTKVSCSTEFMANQILNKAVNESVWTSAIRDTLTDCGVESLTDAEISTVTRQQTYLAVGEIVNRRARVGFSTTGHTGIDVNVYAFGPGKENFYGNHNNIDLASKVANIFDLDLEAATKKL